MERSTKKKIESRKIKNMMHIMNPKKKKKKKKKKTKKRKKKHTIKPKRISSKIIFCSHDGKNQANVHCRKCNRNLCDACNALVHQTKKHPVKCEECKECKATIHCKECDQYLCDKCDT